MNAFLHPRWRVIFGVLLLIWLVVVAGIGLSGLRQTFPLPVSAIRYDAGCAYIIDLHPRPVGWPITTFVSDTLSANTVSGLLLLEGGNPIGWPHTLHREIRTYGSGHYSHWNRELFFSASDCSDPRSNGRRYEVTIPIDLSRWTIASWFIAVVIFGLIVKTHFATNQHVGQFFAFARKASHALFSPLDLAQRPILCLGFFLLLAFGAWTFLAGVWSSGTPTNFAIAGFYQISDASIWWFCSNALLDDRTFGNQGITGEWCQGRAIYPTFLSGISLLGGRTMVGTLLLQALLVSAAIFVFLRRSSSYIGVVGAALCGALLFRFATANVFSQAMTENAGLIFGCIGFAFLLKATENRLLTWVVAGIGMISIALNARAGAFFVLPCLVLWAGLFAYFLHQRVWQWVLAACGALLVGFALQAALVLTVGGDPSHSQGKFSERLYGLSVGGQGWNQVFKDHPEVSELPSNSARVKAIYALAWENLMAQPALFLQGLSKNLSVFLTQGTYDYQILGWWGSLLKLCWWLAWIPLLVNYKNPAYLMMTLSSLGVVLSAPFLMGAAGERFFAATVPVDVMQIGVGVYFAGRILLQGLKGLFASNFEQPMGKSARVTHGPTYVEPMAGLLFLVILVIPHTPLRHLQAQSTVEVAECQNGEETVATRIGKGGTQLMDIVSDSQKADVFRGEIRRKDFVDVIPNASRWHYEALAFRGASVVRAYQLAAHDPAAPGPYRVFANEHLARYHKHLVRLCIDTTETQVIFGRPYSRLNSITILN